MTGYTRTGRCCVCGFRVCDHYLGQRFIPCVQLLDQRRDFRFEQPDAADGYPEITDEALQAIRARIATRLDHGRSLR